MYRVIATAVTPVALAALAPFGITADTTVEEAIFLLLIGLSTGAVAWWAQRSRRQD